MKFENSLEIKELKSSIFSLDTIWNAMLQKVLYPEKFIDGLEKSSIKKISDKKYKRFLFFGENSVTDYVFLFPMEKMIFKSMKSNVSIGGSLEITVCQKEDFYGLTFLYSNHIAEDSMEAFFLKNAYRLSDNDTVLKIKKIIFDK